ncbi:MAG: hypothetical protein IPH07_36000 [Deltaproteobacteria bacterium]|nr:hypothetical protein [Deltaproteobacteria bacterium]MBK8235590.1 hypothetical protein [Deltaproteobacteria bacterium]MBK8713223.1 hypothetical protein [Deltaproteobacteria bacterium]MBP7288900.1 hypothetical protein [Nannocystaceae bacterium]
MLLRSLSILLFATAGLSACNRPASNPTPPSETPKADDTAAATPHDPNKPFHELDKDGKMKRMTDVVMPELGALFREYDATRYAKFDCATCHVNHAHHPKDGLPKIKLSDGGYEQLVKEKPELMEFMGKVAPAMAKAMAEPPFDPATGQGFGCGGCHTVE